MKRKRIGINFFVLILFLVILFFIAINIGSIDVSLSELLKGLFIEYNKDIATIYDLRFPRIIIAMLAGAMIAVSGTLFQAILKNPLADPGIIGISSGAGFISIVMIIIFPTMIKIIPLLGILGGLLAFGLVYSLSWKKGLSPLRVLLVGIAIQALFTGLSTSFNSLNGGNLSGVASIVNGNINMKTWNDVSILSLYGIPILIGSLFCCNSCDLLALEDKTVKSLGVDINKKRMILSIVAVSLAAVSTSIVGVIGFLGLLVPHIARLIIGNKHKVLIPFVIILGAFTFLLADTLGRAILPPYEINASVIMSVIGGPIFIILLRREGGIYGK